MQELKYGFSKTLDGVSMHDAQVRVREALAGEGFGVLTEIDYQATMKKKLDVDVEPYVILGACNPEFAHQAVSHDVHLGLLLPCNVVVRQQGGTTVVEIIDPKAMFAVVDHPAMDPIVTEVRERLQRAITNL